MATLVDLDGFGHQVAVGAQASSTFIGTYDIGTFTSITFDTSVKRRADHLASMKMTMVNGTSCAAGRNLATSAAIIVVSFYFRVSAAPSVNSQIFRTSGPANNCRVLFNTTGTLTAGFLTGEVTTSTTYADGLWHRLDMRITTGGVTTYLLDWYVDGAAQTQATRATQTAANITAWGLGESGGGTAGTLTIWFSDVVISATTGDFPIGEHHVLPLYPNADGTHNLLSHIAGEGAETTNLYQHVDDYNGSTPDTATYLHQSTIDTAAFAEVAFQDPNAGDTTIWDVNGYLAGFASTTGADQGVCKILTAHGGTFLSFIGNDATNAGLVDYSGSTTVLGYTTSSAASSATLRSVITRPSGGWDNTKLSAVVAQWGFSGDVIGEPRLSALLLEYAAPETNISVTPTTVTSATTVPTPVEAADAGTTPTTVADIAAVPTPVVAASANVTTTTVADAASVPTPTVEAITASGDADITTSTVIGIVAIPTPSVSADANVTPTTVTAVAAVAGASSVVATAAITPTPVAVVTLISVPTTTADARAPPDTVAASAAVPTPSTTADADTTPDTVETAAGVPTPDVVTFSGNRGEINQTLPAFTQAAVGIRSIDADVTPDPVLAFADVPRPSGSGDANVTPDTVEAVASVSEVFQASTSIDIGGPPTPPVTPPAHGGGMHLVAIHGAVRGEIHQTMPAFTQHLEANVNDDELVLLLI